MGKIRGDVDDGLALMLALADSALVIRGISTVWNVSHTNKVTAKLLKWYAGGRTIPVYEGANGLKDTGIETGATTALSNALMHERLTIVVLGPATNIASLLALHPEVIPRIDEIVFCMGRTPGLRFAPGRTRELPDYNFELDPEAMRQILKTNLKLSFIGYEAASSIRLNKDDIQIFRKSARKGDKWVYRQLKAWNWKWKVFLASKQGFIPFDAVTVAYALAPGYLRCQDELPVALESAEEKKEKMVLVINPQVHSEKKVTYCDFTQQGYKTYLLKQLSYK